MRKLFCQKSELCTQGRQRILRRERERETPRPLNGDAKTDHGD